MNIKPDNKAYLQDNIEIVPTSSQIFNRVPWCGNKSTILSYGWLSDFTELELKNIIGSLFAVFKDEIMHAYMSDEILKIPNFGIRQDMGSVDIVISNPFDIDGHKIDNYKDDGLICITAGPCGFKLGDKVHFRVIVNVDEYLRFVDYCECR